MNVSRLFDLTRHYWMVLPGLALVASCTVHNTVPLSEQPVVLADTPTQPGASPDARLSGTRVYNVESAASTVHILVYRGGSLARLGHNHVISLGQIAGRVWQHETYEGCGFDIQVPVNELLVDDNAARQAEGSDFPLNIPDDARQGTRDNMLSPAVLDGAQFPFITIKSIGISGVSNTASVTLSLTIRDRVQHMQVPVTLEASDNTLRVQGEFDIKQTDFGIEPFSVAMGALRVMDVVKVRFDLVAAST